MNSKKKLPTVTIGIPAYNEEANIANLLTSVTRQKGNNYLLEKIIVALDGCTDKTTEIVRKFANKNKKLQLLIGKKRKGKAYRLNQLIRKSSSDYIILVDADFILKLTVLTKLFDNLCLDTNRDVMLSTGQQIAVKPDNFFSKILAARDLFLADVNNNWKCGNNIYSFKGGFLVMHKKFSSSLTIPSISGNDAYIYLSAIVKNHPTYYCKEVQTFFVAPRNFADHLKQSIRFQKSKKIMRAYFGECINKEYSIPFSIFFSSLIKTFLKKPHYLFAYMGLNLCTKFIAHIKNTSYVDGNGTWEVSKSTKQLITKYS